MVAIDAPENVSAEQVRVNANEEYGQFCELAHILKDLGDAGHINCETTGLDIKVKDKFHQLREMAEREFEDHIFPKLPLCDESSESVCLNDRDSAVTSLRCLQMFYRFGADTFATAVHILDRFLSRIKVKRKYLSCVTAATYFLSAKFHEDSETTPKATELSHLHQLVWKSSDLKRMELIILEKLGWDLWSRTTPLSFLRIIFSILQLLDIPGLVKGLFETVTKLLEICLNHTICAHFRPCTLAVCALRYYIKHYGPASIIINFLLLDVQNICQIADSEMLDCYCAVSKQLLDYDSQVLSSPPSLPVRKKPMFKFGHRSRLSFYENSLPTIQEVCD
ncbi:hypothetical protein ACJMK2_032986 [Sinanodonta woodiana]|uniref:Cyclin-like domain-containing protein n=1 Tax=Sinanodonta woodiana TaxID=1069815 RepID=A0ABD3X4Z1_SINWO